MSRLFLLLYIPMGLSIALTGCHKGVTQADINKIEFNYTAVDNTGLKHQGAFVDYEFCIPAKSSCARQVQHIEAQARIMPQSKGRIRCSDKEWLCVISYHDENWKKKLFEIAALPFVKRIQETFYE